MPFKFYLTDTYNNTEITEPKGWGDVRNILERDFKSHGMFSNYTDGTLKLGFVCDAADLLEAEYIANGIDGYYLFRVEEAEENSTTYAQIFSAEIDFSTRQYDEDFFEAEVNNSTSFLKIKNRADKKIALNFQQTLDGSIRNRVNYNGNIYSLATKMNNQYIGTNAGETLSAQQSETIASETYLIGTIAFDGISSDEIEKSKDTLTTLEASDVYEDVLVKRYPILTVDKESELFVQYDFDFDIDLTEDQGSGTTTYIADLIIVFNTLITQGGINSFQLDLDNDSGLSPHNATITLAATDSTSIFRVPAGGDVSIVLRLRMTTTGAAQFSASLDITKFDFTITNRKATMPTLARWYNVHDAINKQLDFITNDSNFLYSEILGDQLRGYASDGCFADLLITNGYQIRQLNDDDKTPIQSLKDYTENIQTIAAVGWGLEEIESPLQVGYFDVYWLNISSGTGSFYIYENLVYDITIGDNIGFYNSETLFGVYEVTNLVYNVSLNRTTIYIDVSNNGQFFDAFAGLSNPLENTWYYELLITSTCATETRERLRIEQWEHFYGTSELINLGTVEEYSEEPFNDALYNAVEVEFSKYANDENKSSTLQEFQTSSEWSLPAVKADKALNLISKWIGSTFLFQETRDRIFSKKPTTSFKYDKDIFFATSTSQEVTATVDFNSATSTVTFDAKTYENYIANSIFFSVIGATDASNNGSYQIDTTETIIRELSQDTYEVTMTGGDPAATRNGDTVLITITYFSQPEQRKIESNENMIQTTGLDMPAYMMNQRNTIKRFLFRWGTFINSTIAYLIQSTSKTIRNLFYDVNGDFAAEIDTYDLDADCVNVQGLVQENANVSTADLGSVKFAPNLIYATKEICDTDYEAITDAHKGKGSNPYGYFSVTTPNNEFKQGWLMSMRRSPIDRIAEFKLLERYNPDIVFDGTVYGEVANAAAFQITDFRFTMIMQIDAFPGIGENIAPFVDCMPLTTDKGWYFSPWEEDGLVGAFANSLGGVESQAARYQLAGDKTYKFFIQKLGQDYQFGYNDVTLLDFTIVNTNPAPTDSFIFGIRRNMDSGTVLTGNCKLIKLEGRDGSGNIISELMRYEGANNNGVSITNTATDAPANTDFIWNNV